MNLNKTTATLITDVLQLMVVCYNSSILEGVTEYKELVSNTFQTIYDFDMEGMMDTVFFTVFQTSSDDDYDRFIVEFKSWFFETLTTSRVYYDGNLETTINEWINDGGVHPNDDPFQGEETDSSSDLIPDEIYGDVDPEDVSFLNQLLKL